MSLSNISKKIINYSLRHRHTIQNTQISSTFYCENSNLKLSIFGVHSVRHAKSIILHDEVIRQQKKQHQLEQSREDALDKEIDPDMPISDLSNPFEKKEKKCILCEHDIELDYKNPRLLSQFVSSFTGQIYGRHITGLCVYKQRRLANTVKRARWFGFMSYTVKDPRYLKDPKLFDPFKRI